AYIIKCERVVKDADGEIVELRCTADLESLDGATAARRVKGTIHWVSAADAVTAELRLYDRLFKSEDPGEDDRDPLTDLNPTSLERSGVEVGQRVAVVFARILRLEQPVVEPQFGGHRIGRRHPVDRALDAARGGGAVERLEVRRASQLDDLAVGVLHHPL